MSDLDDYLPLFAGQVAEIFSHTDNETEQNSQLLNLYRSLPIQLHMVAGERGFIKYCHQQKDGFVDKGHA